MFVLRISRGAYAGTAKRFLACVLVFLLSVFVMSTTAYAVAIPPGPSCAATNTGLLDLDCPGGVNCSRGGTFSAGETITFTINIVGGPFSLNITPGGGGVTNATNSTTFVYLVPADATYTFGYKEGYSDLIYLNILETKVNETELKLIEAQGNWFVTLAQMQAALGLDPLEQSLLISELPLSDRPGPGRLPNQEEDEQKLQSEWDLQRDVQGQ